MYRYLPNGMSTYDLFAIVSVIAIMVFNLLQFKRKTKRFMQKAENCNS